MKEIVAKPPHPEQLAAVVFPAFADKIRGIYEDVSRDLGANSPAQLSIENRLEEHRRGVENLEFVGRVFEILPDNALPVDVPTQRAAKVLLAHTVYTLGLTYRFESCETALVVGEKVKAGDTVGIILAGECSEVRRSKNPDANIDRTMSIVEVTTTATEYKAMLAFQGKMLTSEFNDDELEQLFDSRTGRHEITAENWPGAKLQNSSDAEFREHDAWRSKKVPRFSTKASRHKNFETWQEAYRKERQKSGTFVIGDGVKLLEHELSDTTMEDYGVYARLAHLAVAFEVEDSYQLLLQNRLDSRVD